MGKPPSNVVRETEALRDQLHRHNHRYYVLDDPVVSAAEYDELFTRLVDLESKDPQLADPSSPTQRVGAPPLDKFESCLFTCSAGALGPGLGLASETSDMCIVSNATVLN